MLKLQLKLFLKACLFEKIFKILTSHEMAICAEHLKKFAV